MTTANDARRAHDLLDRLGSLTALSKEQEKLLRSFLPERPKQVTLEQLRDRVHAAWGDAGTCTWDRDEDLDDFLLALRDDLSHLINEPKPTVPALPAGMRLADHEKYGRCVVSPKSDAAGVCDVMHIDSSRFIGSKFEWAHECELTFIDEEPAHPEFLETEADYENAPVGTVVARDNGLPWVKEKSNYWTRPDAAKSDYGMSLGSRRVLRWGWGE